MFALNDILDDLRNGKRKNMILDTDAYNEVDDQFAIAYALLSEGEVNLKSLNAAPFFNNRSSSAKDGMLKSYDEILHILSLVGRKDNPPVYRGSETFLGGYGEYVPSEAADNITENTKGDELTYVVCIGAITNFASALIKDPTLAERTVLVWLGGHSFSSPNAKEFNLFQDITASQIVFDSKVPMIQIPCEGVCTEFLTTVPELEYYLGGKNELCDYLTGIVKTYTDKPYGWSKVIWDVTAVATLTKPRAFRFEIKKRPSLTRDFKYLHEGKNGDYIYVGRIRRDPIYADLFGKLSGMKTN